MSDERIIQQLKLGVWIYFFLLIFEGALRKWVLPGLSAPLLIVRDPIAIWLIFRTLSTGVWKPNGFVALIFCATVLSLVLALFIGHGNIYVALYGFRITAIHFPLIFIIGRILDREDVIKMGKITLWITIGMTFLVAWQFFSPQSAWVNRGVGGDMEGSGFGGAAGFFRVPGTFSFTNGLSFFYGLATAYIFYFWFSNKREVPKFLLFAATIALVAAIPLSISRTVFFQIALTFAFAIAIAGKNPKIILRLLGIAIAAICCLIILSNFNFFQTAMFAFQERFTTANEVEGGVVEGVFIDRFLGGMYGQISKDDFEFWGAGLGMGTNAGAKMLVGERGFLIAEAEWGRVVGEMGFIFGLAVIIIRGGVAFQLVKQAWNAISKENILPWLLTSFGMFLIIQGQWAQPTTLGFSVLIGGLILAAHSEE